MASSPRSSTSLQRRPLDSAGDFQMASFLLTHDGQRPLRTRPRRLLILLFTAAVAILLLLSQRPLLSGYVQPYRASPSRLPAISQNVVTPTGSSIVPTVAIEHAVEPVVFALLMHSEVSAKEGAILLKSAIMYTSRPLEFHIICDDEAIAYLHHRLRLLTHPVHPITVRLYRLTLESMMDRITREGSLNTGHAAGVRGLMKLFLHEILPDKVEKAIYVDTDAFFLTDPALLWEEFSLWGPNIAVSIPYHPNLARPEWYNASEICSCIMLLHLDRLRSVRLMDSSIYRADRSGLYPPALAPPTFTALFGPPGPHGYHHVALGDQSYWWAIVSNRREIFQPLPYDWEVTSCLLDMYGTSLGSDGISEDEEKRAMVYLDDTPYDGTIVTPKLVHFNCFDDDAIYYNSLQWSNPELSMTKRWGPAVQYHVGFKWLWLNRGPTKLPADIQLILDPLFADQRFAAEHPESSNLVVPGRLNADTSERARRHPEHLRRHRRSPFMS